MWAFLKTLLTAPVALPWLFILVACLSLLVMIWIVAYLVALLHVYLAKSWRELTVASTRARLAWAWGWIAASFLLLSYAATLTVLQRVSSWVAAVPYLVVILIGILIATSIRHQIRNRVRAVQRVVQGGRG